MSAEPPVLAGAVDPRIAAELPGLGVAYCEVAVAGDVRRRSPRALRARLRALSDRTRGSHAVALRARPIPHAYRALFRHLGVEPDVDRIPAEELMLERLKRGAYPSRGLLADALLVATVETEVGVWALDAERDGAPRLALAGDRIVVAGERGTIAPVFAPPPETGRVARLVLYAITAPRVPEIAVEEALWIAWDILERGDEPVG